MSGNSNGLVQKLWNYCNILRDDGLSYGDYVEKFVPGSAGLLLKCQAVHANIFQRLRASLAAGKLAL